MLQFYYRKLVRCRQHSLSLAAIIFLWSGGSVLHLLRRHRLLLLVTGKAALAVCLHVLDLLKHIEIWVLPLALPLTVLVGTLIGGISAITRVLQHRVFAILAVIIVSVGLFLSGIETVLSPNGQLLSCGRQVFTKSSTREWRLNFFRPPGIEKPDIGKPDR